MSMSKVSIIIPVYNTEEFLEECLDSLLDQTYKNIEVIIVNDGSTDNSKEIIETYVQQYNKMRAIHLNKNHGAGACRNIGIEQATGTYVYFLDSDDWLDELTIELLMNQIESSEVRDVLQGSLVRTSKSRKAVLSSEKEQMEAEQDMADEDEDDVVLSKKFKLFSARNLLISMDVLKKKQLKFYEDGRIYTDYSFTLPLLLDREEIPVSKLATYYKRRRNDPINNPSLSQSDREVKVADYLQSIHYLKDIYNDNKKANEIIDYSFINFYNRNITLLFQDSTQMERFFDEFRKITSRVDLTIHKNAKFIVKKQLRLAIKNKKDTFYRLLKIHDWLRKLRHGLTSKRRYYIFLYRQVFMRLPLKDNRVLFESFLGKNYSCSPKYIYEYMLKENPDYDFIWVFNKTGKKIPGQAKQVKRFGLRYYYYMATSKYWVSNSRIPASLDKREGNVYLQTWHGTPLKKLVFDMNDIHSANPKYKSIFFKQSRRWDYLLAPNQYSSDIFRRAFMFDKQMIEVGYPRNDILYDVKKGELAEKIKERLHIPKNKKIILYAPTWRDDEFYAPGKYKFNLKLNLKQMKQELGDEYFIILRMHYFIADHIETTGLDDFVINLSSYDDISELYLISDILMTDYSSVFFDYANLQRPILFYTYDLEKYRDTLRGFYIDVEKEVPGPLLKTTEEVIDAIKNLPEINEQYKHKYDEFYRRFCHWDDGRAAQKVVEQVFKDR